MRLPSRLSILLVIVLASAGILMELKSPALYPGIEQQVAEEFSSFPGYVQSAVRAQRLVVQSFDWSSGVDGVITNFPDVLEDVLAERRTLAPAP